MSFLQIKEEILSIGPDTIFYIGNFPIANTFLAILLLIVVFLIGGLWISRNFKVRPVKGQVVVELVYDMMKNLILQITTDGRHFNKIFFLVATLFVYLTFANLMSIVPGLTSLTYKGASIFRTPTTDFNTTFGLALAMVILTQVVSVREWGMFGYFGRFLQFKRVYAGFRKSFGEGLVAVIGFFVGLLDIISELAKVISLSLRLFGNIYAGEVLAIVVMGFIAYGFPSAVMALSIFFGIIQAMVFGSLVAAYYMSMTNPELDEVEKTAKFESNVVYKN